MKTQNALKLSCIACYVVSFVLLTIVHDFLGLAWLFWRVAAVLSDEIQKGE